VVKALEEMAVEQCAKERGRGIEDAARFLRYRLLEETAEAQGGGFVCLGHTRNDQLETILYRFLQGSGAGGGIPRRRGRFLRPLLDTGRDEVEAYFAAQGASYRTDATNRDTSYMRNRVRLLLMPQLDALFPGWRTAVLAGAEKAAEDKAAVDTLAEGASWDISTEGKTAQMDEPVFFALPKAARRELVYRACNALHVSGRLPYRLISRFISNVPEASAGSPDVAEAAEVVLEKKAGKVRVKRTDTAGKGGGFFAVIEKPGRCRFPFGSLVVSESPVEGAIPVSLPVCVRSRLSEDAIQTAPGIRQNLNALFTNYGIPPEVRDLLPVIETIPAAGKEKPEIRFVCGALRGYRNWKAWDVSDDTSQENTGKTAYMIFEEPD
jgi:tRNA(Ile)-lysidine synthase